MGPQSHRRANCENFETPIWESQDKLTLGAGLVARHKVYYKGEGGGFPQVRVVVSLANPCLLVVHSYIKMLQLHTNQLVI
jgi:hypothetical protein